MGSSFGTETSNSPQSERLMALLNEVNIFGLAPRYPKKFLVSGSRKFLGIAAHFQKNWVRSTKPRLIENRLLFVPCS